MGFTQCLSLDARESKRLCSKTTYFKRNLIGNHLIASDGTGCLIGGKEFTLSIFASLLTFTIMHTAYFYLPQHPQREREQSSVEHGYGVEYQGKVTV